MSDRCSLEAPLGIFDSGPGGLAVLREVRRLLPDEDILYLGDTAHLPYELRPREEVAQFTINITRFLAAQGVKTVIIACNTASVSGLDAARKAVPECPVFGMIEPGVRAALAASAGRRFGVMGSIITINSRAYDSMIAEQRPGARTLGVATPELFRYVEKGRLEDRATLKRLIEMYNQPIAEFGADALILGCTDLTCVRDLIAEVAGPRVLVVDPAEEVVRELRAFLDTRGQLRHSHAGGPEYRFFVTGSDVEDFAAYTARFVGLISPDVTHVSVETVHGTTV